MQENKKSLFQFLVLIILVITVNFISSRVFFRLDLTSDNRYTLKDKTKQILEDLDDVVYFKVYLEGNLPVGLQRMQNRIKETLDEFRVYAGDNIQYRFINPSSEDDPRERQNVYNDLQKRGLKPTNVKRRDKEGGYTQKIIFPGAIVNHGEKQTVVNMLKNNPGLSAEQNLNHSIQALEYELIDAIYKLTLDKMDPIAFLEGHGELDKFQVGDITNALSSYYRVDRVSIEGDPELLMKYNSVIIAKPLRRFSEADKFAIDQYVMHGGNVLWLIDRVDVSMDSLSQGSETFAKLAELNLSDQLFKYGVRINPDLVKDLQCAVIPVNTSYQNDQPKFSPTPWTYFPLLSGNDQHPVSKSLNMVRTEFVSSIDTLPATAMDKTVLLSTSPQTRLLDAPTVVSLREVEQRLDPRRFDQGRLVTGILLEGEFQSVFKNRFVDTYLEDADVSYREQSKNNRMIVISDGDIIRNDVRHKPEGTYISQLGYDKYTRQTYGNKNFLINCVHYLADKSGLIEIRGKEVKLRLLDKSRVQKERVKWQIINVLIPVLLIFLFGLIMNILRRRKYTR